MKRRPSFALLAAIALPLGLAGVAYRHAYPRVLWGEPVASDPSLEMAETIDIGPQEFATIADAQFTVRNRGGSTLILDQFRSGCACNGFERKVGDAFYLL